jgi:hypothetical protein
LISLDTVELVAVLAVRSNHLLYGRLFDSSGRHSPNLYERNGLILHS